MHAPATARPGVSRSQLLLHVAAGLISLLLISVLVIRASDAAFSATTQNPNDQWTAGDVVLTDDDTPTDTAMFSVSNMAPLASVTNCIKVSYSGSLNASVKIYGSLSVSNLAPYLNLTVTRGTGGSFGSCGGYSMTDSVYSGTLSGFVAAHSGWATGASPWAATGGAPVDDMTYQFVVTLQDNNLAQGKSATATFTWEAQNT